MRRHLLGILVEQGFATYEQTEDQRPVVNQMSVAMWLAFARSQGMPACLSSLIHAKEAGTEPIYTIYNTIRYYILLYIHPTLQILCEEFSRRKLQLLRSLLCAALWPNVMLLSHGCKGDKPYVNASQLYSATLLDYV